MTIASKALLSSLLLLLLYLPTARAQGAEFAKGADISWINQEEAAGKVFRDAAGKPTDFFALISRAGINAVRLRVWVNPADGRNDGTDVLSKARRAQALGMRVMIDFHYSDTWTDPGQQAKPVAWNTHDQSELVKDVYAHTQGILSYLKSNGIDVSWIQVGNEINSGMQWPNGHTPYFQALAQLIDSGYAASKAVYPEAKVIVHLANGYKNADFRWFFDNLKAAGGHWDAIGMSLYPDDTNWQDYITKIAANMQDMVARYGCDVVVSEVGMRWEQASAARAMLGELIRVTHAVGPHGLGVFYWEPDAYPDWERYGMGAVNDRGQLTQAMDAFH